MEINIDHEGVVAGIADVGLVEDGHGLRRLAVAGRACVARRPVNGNGGLLRPDGAVLGLSDETQGGKRAGRAVGVDPVCRRDARLAVGQDLTVKAEFRARKSNRGVGRLCILRRGGQRGRW